MSAHLKLYCTCVVLFICFCFASPAIIHAGGGDGTTDLHFVGRGECSSLGTYYIGYIILYYGDDLVLDTNVQPYHTLSSKTLYSVKDVDQVDVTLKVNYATGGTYDTWFEEKWSNELTDGTHTYQNSSFTLRLVRDGDTVEMYCD